MNKIAIIIALWGICIPGFTLAENSPMVSSSNPELIPFNQVLFNDYCRHKADACEKTGRQVFNACILGMVFTSLGIYAAYENGDKIVTNLGEWCKSKGFNSSLWSGGALVVKTTFSLYSFSGLLSTIKHMCASITTLGSQDYDAEIDEWNRLICASRDEQEQVWHITIYEKLGKPVVHGARQEAMPYTLKFNKKNGIGKVALDPYSIEDVSILLGIHETKKDICLCDELYIVT